MKTFSVRQAENADRTEVLAFVLDEMKRLSLLEIERLSGAGVGND